MACSDLPVSSPVLSSSIRLFRVVLTVFNLSMNFLASDETFSPAMGNMSSFSCSTFLVNSDFF